ncbi:hypothetical protein DKT77_01890 [Meridianimarinicoccus roseus]|jgi:YVTN family beta-propeller protein|uniref:YNCE-like beta-propeller domain-containing protein n=1 Tax=Meridianimarinicoccus roseus TaxID=2072018 RepID=A0A2V2LF78_9RHOB|nr:YncE family protein [Meridianimarinicoccus roseus]PWR04270.1 hypothetical protein DKT77_01890 [Meridianimarinicoccus roseus]
MRWSSGSVRRVADAALALVLLAVPAEAEIAHVTCQNGDALSVIDLTAAAETDRWAVPGQPAGVAAGPETVFTVSAGSKAVRRWSRQGTLLAQTVLSDGGPIGVAHDAARGRLFVSDWYNARIWVLDDIALATQAELATGAAPAGLALSGDGRWLASADRDADRVTIFDAATLALHRTVTVGTRPFGLRFDPGGRLFVGNVGSNDVSVIDPTAGRVTATVPVGERPYGIAFAAGRAFVSNQYADTVSVIDLATLDPNGLIEVGEYPEGIDATADGRYVAVANWFGNTLSVIDATSLGVVEEIATCDGPRAFGAFLVGGEK